jgi:hypothetical protein
MADDDKSVKTLATILNGIAIIVLIGYTYTLISSGQAELDLSFDATQLSLTFLAVIASGLMLGHYSKKSKYGAFAGNIGVMIVIMSMIAIFVTPRSQFLLPIGVLGLLEVGIWFWGKGKTEYGKRQDQQKAENALAKDVDKKEARLTRTLNKTAEKFISSAKKIEEQLGEIIKFLRKDEHSDFRVRLAEILNLKKVQYIIDDLKEKHPGIIADGENPDLVDILKALKIEEKDMEEHQEKLELIYMLPVLIQNLEKGEDRAAFKDVEHQIFRRILRLEKRVKGDTKEEIETIGYEMQLLQYIQNEIETEESYLKKVNKKTKEKFKESGKELNKMIGEILDEYKKQLKLMGRELKKEGKLKRIAKKEEGGEETEEKVSEEEE